MDDIRIMHHLYRFFCNVLTATRHPAIGLEYGQWRVGRALGRPLFVDGAFNTRVQADTYSELLSTRGFVPSWSETQMIRNLSSNYPVFVDVGANVGVWTVALAAAHPNAHVYCLEPTPSTFTMLCNNIALNRLRNVTAAPLALSDSDGLLSFQVSENASIFNRLAPGKESAEDVGRGRFANARTIEVKSIRLDELCNQRCIDRIGFLKIDVEGAEVCVLKGAEHLLRNQAIDLIWIEVEPDNLREMGDSVDDLAAFMANVGYTFHILRPDGSPSAPVDVRCQRSANMMAKPK